MKKFMLLATAVGLTLTSCVNNEETPTVDTRSAITFDAPVMKTSRAEVQGEIMGVQYPTDENFKVFSKIYKNGYKGWTASDSIADYFAEAGDDAKHEGGSYWSTTTTYYWPDAGYNLAFAAYSPAVLGTACNGITKIERTAEGFKITDFVSEPESDNQYDLMYSHTVYDRNKSNNASSAVSLKFEHALSSIVFSSQKSDAAVNYEITDVNVTGKFYTTGDFNQGITGTTSTEGVYTENEAPKWDLTNETTIDVNYDPTFTPFNVPSATPEIFTQGTSAILAIPQGVPTDAKVHVTYVKTTNIGLETETTTTHTAEIFLKDFKKATADGVAVAEGIDEWERGKRYVYRIAFGENQRIYFEPAVTEWAQQPTLIYTIK